jgi:lysozyme
MDPAKKLTIGVGRNLTDRGLSDDEIEYLLTNDVVLVLQVLDARIPWWKGLDEVRSRVLADMAFNLGPDNLVNRWPVFLSQVQRGDFEAAAENMRQQPWYGEVGVRGVRLVSMMRTGADALPKGKRGSNAGKQGKSAARGAGHR